MTWLAWGVAVVAIAVASVCWVMGRREAQAAIDASVIAQRSQRSLDALTLSEIEREIQKPRYLIQMSDWGPDFTGEDQTLPRWRWVIYDVHAGLRALVAHKPPPPDDFVMLGNSDTAEQAWVDANAWTERSSMKLVQE